jgi:SAM-dependent methyltransferase
LTHKQREIYSGEFSGTFGRIHIPKLNLVRKTIRQIAGKNKIERILDLASGDGLIAKELEILTKAEVVACDVSPACADKVRKKNLQVILTDLNRGTPIQDETFDMVTALDIYEHVEELDYLQEEIHRILKPGGFLVLITPNLGSLIERIFLFLGYQPLGIEVSKYRKFGTIPHKGKERPVGHIRTLTLRALKELLDYYGFGVICIKRCPLDTAYPSLNLIDNSIGRLFPSLSNELLIVCRKLPRLGKLNREAH